MKVSGVTFVRNAVKFDYPVVESIESILPICDEFIVNVGESEDATLDLVESVGDPRVRIIRSAWDERSRTGGRILSEQTDVALAECRGDWIFYIQADEVMHEKYLDVVRRRMEMLYGAGTVQGLLFDFVHFYSSYRLVQGIGRWYRREIRVIRNNLGVSSWKDAQGFRLNGAKLKVASAHAEIYHYGWARDPRVMFSKQKNFDRYWHDDEWIEKRWGDDFAFETGGLVPFKGAHPAVMKQRIAEAGWDVFADPARLSKVKTPRFAALRSLISRIGEYKNYRLISDRRLPREEPRE
jgi:glycosyltransferase involved in cell wall biosynthesis